MMGQAVKNGWMPPSLDGAFAALYTTWHTGKIKCSGENVANILEGGL